MSDQWNSKEVSEVLDTVSEKVPKLIKGIMDNLYSEDSGKQLGKSVGNFYKELLDAGISTADALSLTKEYLGTLKDFKTSMNK